MLLCGIFSGGIYASVLAHKRKYHYVELILFTLFLFLGVVVGGSLLSALVNSLTNPNILQASIMNITTITDIVPVLVFLFGGTIFYGGLLGALLVGWICVRKNSEYSKYIDIIAVCIPLFHFFGRIGCFLGGCCFGIESSFGFTLLHSPIIVANEVSRFPVQLLEALFNISLFFLLNYCLHNNKFKNRLLYVYLLIYPIGRFFIEFLRGDEHRGIWLFLSTSQLISIIIFAAVLIKVIRLKREKPKALAVTDRTGCGLICDKESTSGTFPRAPGSG